VLVINDSNAAKFFVSDHMGTWLSIPVGYRIVDVQTTQNFITVLGIRPASGNFPNYTRLTVMGNIGFAQGLDLYGDYRTSVLLYSYRDNSSYGYSNTISHGMVEAYVEFMIKDKVWFTTLY